MNWLKELFDEIRGAKQLVWEIGDYPYFKGMKNMNHSRCNHKRRILRKMMMGERLSAQTYSERHHTTKLGARVHELRNEYGLPVDDVWVKPDSGNRYKEYYIDVNKLRGMM